MRFNPDGGVAHGEHMAAARQAKDPSRKRVRRRYPRTRGLATHWVERTPSFRALDQVCLNQNMNLLESYLHRN